MANTKIDFNVDVVDFNDVKYNTGRLALATAMGNSAQAANSPKLWDWIKCLKANGILELDNTDIDLLKAFINATDTLTVAGRGPLTDIIDAAGKDE